MAQLNFTKQPDGFFTADVVSQGQRMGVHVDLKEAGSLSVLAGLSGMQPQPIYEAQSKTSHVFEIDVPNGISLVVQTSKEPLLGKWV